MANTINTSRFFSRSKVTTSESRFSSASFFPNKNDNLSTLQRIETNDEFIQEDPEVIQLNEIYQKVLKIERILGLQIKIKQSKTEVTRKETEKREFEESEKRLEAPKIKGFRLPSIKLPGSSFLGNFMERVKRFLFFVALGWLFPRILPILPFLKNVALTITKVYSFAEGLFGHLFNGFMSLVKFGGELKEKTIGFINQLKGGNDQKEFDKLENLFNRFVDASIIASVLALDMAIGASGDPKSSPRGGFLGTSYSYDRKRALIRKKYGDSAARIYDNLISNGKSATQAQKIIENRYIKKGKITPQRMTGSLGGGISGSNLRKRGILRSPRRFLIRKFGRLPKKPKLKAPSWWTKITGSISSKFSKLGAKLAGPFSKFAGAAVPGLGAAIGFIDAKARSESGDKLGAFLAGLSAGLDAFTAAVAVAGIAAAATGIGLPGAAILGTVAAAAGSISMAIDIVLLIRDILKAINVPVFNKGGTISSSLSRLSTGKTDSPNKDEKIKDPKKVTRGGKRVDRPARRTIKAETLKKPPRIKPLDSSPGKDVGGESRIQRLFPSPEPTAIAKSKTKPTTGTTVKTTAVKKALSGPTTQASQKPTIDKPNPFNVLTGTSKLLKEIPLIGGLMGSGLDLAMGQKIDTRRIIKPFSSAIKYLIDAFTIEGINFSVTSLFNDLRGFSEGGTVPEPSRMLKMDMFNIEGLLDKLLGPIIRQKVNEAIQNIQKELQKKGELMSGEGGGGKDSADEYEGEYSEGGIATQLGIPKAVSVAKKLIADLGITPAQAAGIVGNFLYESAGMNPAEVEGEPFGVREKPPALGTVGVGYGWAQWTNSRPGDRLDKFLKSYGGDKGKIATDNDNYRFLLKELRGEETLEGMPTNDPQAASDWFRINWERAGVPADEKRRRETRAVYEKIKGLSREQAKRDVISAGARTISSYGRPTAGNGKFIQGNSGRSRGIHYHIGPGSYQTGDILAQKHNASARAAAFKTAKHFLGKKSVVFTRSKQYPTKETSDQELKKMIQTEQIVHTNYGSDGGIDIQVGGAYWPGAKVAFPFKVIGMKYRRGGFGVTAKIAGFNAFVAHGAYDENGKLAPQEETKMYEKGGLTLNRPHVAILGEKGAEFVIDADSTKAIERKFPGLLFSINKAKGYNAVKAIFNYFDKKDDIQTPSLDSINYTNIIPKIKSEPILKQKPNVPNIESFATYETYATENTSIAILPVIMKQPIPIMKSETRAVAFPVVIGADVNIIDSYNKSRGY